MRTQFPVPVHYLEVRLDCGFHVDVIVEDLVIVEVKAVAQLAPIHEAQLLTHLRLSGWPVGLFDLRVLRGLCVAMINAAAQQYGPGLSAGRAIRS